MSNDTELKYVAEPTDLVQGDAKLRENSGDTDTEDHENGSEQ